MKKMLTLFLTIILGTSVLVYSSAAEPDDFAASNGMVESSEASSPLLDNNVTENATVPENVDSMDNIDTIMADSTAPSYFFVTSTFKKSAADDSKNVVSGEHKSAQLSLQDLQYTYLKDTKELEKIKAERDSLVLDVQQLENKFTEMFHPAGAQTLTDLWRMLDEKQKLVEELHKKIDELTEVEKYQTALEKLEFLDQQISGREILLEGYQRTINNLEKLSTRAA